MTPFQACPDQQQNEQSFCGGKTVNQHGYGADLAETPCAENASHMAIASPKNKEELVRQFKFNPESIPGSKPL